MMMKNKSKPKKVVIGIIIFILSCLYINGGYLFIKSTDDSPAKVVVADSIITNKFEAGFGFTFGTFGFGLGLLGGTLCWLVIVVYRWWTKIIDEEKPS